MGSGVPLPETAKYFGRRVAALRTERDIKAKDFAEIVQIHPTTLSNIENGKTKKPSWDTVRAIAAALEVDPTDL